MFNKKKKTKKGFTLVEVLVVVIIIGVLTTIAVPSYMRSVEKARTTQAISTLNQIAKAQNVYNARSSHFANNFMALPLELKDKEGNDVTEREYQDKHFSYVLNYQYRHNARARREFKDNPYYLYVDYVTGEISCEPQRHEICKLLNLKGRESINCFLGESSSGGVLDYDKMCFLKYDYSGTFCTEDREYCAAFKEGVMLENQWNFANKTCYTHENANNIVNAYNGKNWVCKNGKICERDENNPTQCKPGQDPEEPLTEISIECKIIKDKVQCSVIKDGKELDVCDASDPQCFEKYGASGLVCVPKEGKCYTYKDGAKVGECKINKEGTACVEEEPVQLGITYSCSASSCTIYEDGKEISTCSTWDNDCFAKFKVNGLICDGRNHICYEFKDGQMVYACDKFVVGCEEGKLNREHPNDGVACYEDDDYCYTYKNGQLSGYCYKNVLGKDCQKSEESLVCYKDTGICIAFDGEKVIGDCPINNNGTGCAKSNDAMTDGVLCEKETCYIYKGGKVVDTCKANDAGTGCKEEIPECKVGDVACYEKYEVSAFYCDKGYCYTYEKGKLVDTCKVNDAGTGCKEKVEWKEGWVCDGGWTCTEYKNDKPTGNTCYYNGKDGCITGKGKEKVCIGKECRVYVDGAFNKQ
ncbi:MAG: prepilin-type N-terminal cleavage/methylation domain-containing protein [Elusimicrobiaceae bacterium]|nr:prepilin-type N-terminal cleavage/methylation domain-containing protein [Elusimicrobiaceae bacterium]